MTNNNLNNFLVDHLSTVKCTLEVINKNGRGICFILKKGELIGVATDGDIRRYLIKNNSLSDPIFNAMNSNYIALNVKSENKEIRKFFNSSIKIIPLCNDSNQVVDLADIQKSHKIPILEPTLTGNEFIYVEKCLSTNWISSQGSFVRRFEEQFNELHPGMHSLAVSSGTTALELALRALDIRKGDEVIVPDITFAACANTVLNVGATPVFSEIELESWCINVDEVEKLISPKTKAVMAVHLYGQVCNIKKLRKLCDKQNIILIEDCAEAIGSKYQDDPVGVFGDASSFSFFGNKTISTGEGGMVLFKDKNTYNHARILRDHGMDPSKRYWHNCVGFNYRITNIQSAIGVAQMERLNDIVDKKRLIAKWYNRYLSNVPRIFLKPEKIIDSFHSNWLYTIILDIKINRDKVINDLINNGIESRPVFYPLHTMPPYNKYNKSLDLSNSLLISTSGLSLPTSYSLKEQDVEFVCFNLFNILSNLNDVV